MNARGFAGEGRCASVRSDTRHRKQQELRRRRGRNRRRNRLLRGEAGLGLEDQSYQRRVNRRFGQRWKARAVVIEMRDGQRGVEENRGGGGGEGVSYSPLDYRAETFVIRLVYNKCVMMLNAVEAPAGKTV